MKKLLVLAIVLGGAMSFTACKKDYTCECTYDDGNGTTATASYTYKDTKKKAQEACDANEVSVNGTGWTCDIK
ncbi:MAG: hypothetical protein Kow0079_05280 [Vicingaceae bacterium]